MWTLLITIYMYFVISDFVIESFSCNWLCDRLSNLEVAGSSPDGGNHFSYGWTRTSSFVSLIISCDSIKHKC